LNFLPSAVASGFVNAFVQLHRLMDSNRDLVRKIDEPARDAVGSVADDFAGLRLEHVFGLVARTVKLRPVCDTRVLASSIRLVTLASGSNKSQTYASTIAYLAQLIIHRYAMLGILTEEGYPLEAAGILDVPEAEPATRA
jgi:hypothetical protein